MCTNIAEQLIVDLAVRGEMQRQRMNSKHLTERLDQATNGIGRPPSGSAPGKRVIQKTLLSNG